MSSIPVGLQIHHAIGKNIWLSGTLRVPVR
jgi:hypothetical protein